MYSKAEKSNIKKEFWTSFGRYMKPVFNADGSHINWINYKTGVKHIYFRLDAGTKKCFVAIEIKHPIAADGKDTFQKFLSVKNIFVKICGNDWDWVWDEIPYGDDGVPAPKVYCEKICVNVMKKEDWPEIISFLKERIIKLDEFWSAVKINFE